MRREEFEVKEEELKEELLNEAEYGVLSLIAQSEAYGVAVNFVMYEGCICFHGANEGRKVEAIRTNSQASFLVVRPYALIPSYFSNTRSACPATQFFASIHAYGEVEIVDDIDRKAAIMEALMQKLQSEGGYEKIEANNPIYTKMLEKMGVFALKPKTMSMKVKAGQHLDISRHAEMLEKLNSRGSSEDVETAKLMQKMKRV